MDLLDRTRSLPVDHDVAFVVQLPRTCDCDDGYLSWAVYRRLWRTGTCHRIARAPDLATALPYLLAEIEIIEHERKALANGEQL